MSVAFSIFHLDISGKDTNDEQILNILSILVTFPVFQFDISGIDISDLNYKTYYSYL